MTKESNKHLDPLRHDVLAAVNQLSTEKHLPSEGEILSWLREGDDPKKKRQVRLALNYLAGYEYITRVTGHSFDLTDKGYQELALPDAESVGAQYEPRPQKRS